MTTKSIRPLVKWHGGKAYLARRIAALFPKHHTYVEPYGGAASVLLNKEPSEVEVYNDLDFRLTNMFRWLRETPDHFRQLLTLTPYSENSFIESFIGDAADDCVTAVAFYVQCRQSFGGRGERFSFTKHRVRRGMADVVSGWLSSIDENLPLVIERMRTVQIMNRDALKIIEMFDSPETLFYLDPPYMHETREANSREAYSHEMDESAHVKMLGAISGIKGKFVLSGYPHPHYQTWAERCGWRCIEFDLPNNAASGKTKRRMTECCWMNFA